MRWSKKIAGQRHKKSKKTKSGGITMAKLKQNPKVRRFDVTTYLDSEEMISAYLSEVFADGSDAEIQTALIDVARARNMIGSSKKWMLTNWNLQV
jgi:DNA-binding phage protein